MLPKEQFIMNQIWVLAWNASVQRINLYADKTKNNDKFKKGIRKFIEEELSDYYRDKECTEEQHYKNIDKLIETANNIIENNLMGGKYKYAVAQKLLNVWLKSMWCLGFLNRPPHCPIDRYIMKNISSKENWTKIETKDEYKKTIEKIRTVATEEHKSLAEWELVKYNKE